jgi:hypothetical protein
MMMVMMTLTEEKRAKRHHERALVPANKQSTSQTGLSVDWRLKSLLLNDSHYGSGAAGDGHRSRGSGSNVRTEAL